MFVVPPLEDGMSRDEQRARLHAHLDVLIDTDPATDSGPVLEQAVVSAHVLRAFADGREVAVLPAWEASGVWADDGAVSANAALVGLTGRAKAQAGGMRKTARIAKQVPELAAVAASGTLPVSHLHQLADARRPEVAEVFDRDIEVLVKEAKDLSADALKGHLRAWYWAALEQLQRNEPDGPPIPPEPADRLFLTPTFQGRTITDGELGPEAAAIWTGAIDAEIDKWRRAGLTEGRPLPELRAAAATEIMRRYGHDGDRDGTPRPSLVAMADLDTIFDRADIPQEDRMARRAVILDGGPVAATTIQRLLCDCGFTLAIHDRDGEPLWVGREHRTATAAQRKALAVRSGGHCEVPGCVNRHRFEAHHVIWWEHDGPTDIDNLVNLCPGHHHLVHRKRLAITRVDDTFEFRTTNGTLIRGPTYG